MDCLKKTPCKLNRNHKIREWWVSVEFYSENYRRKAYASALRALESGERYDLILENGKTMHRSIFRKNSQHFKALIATLPLVQDWKGLSVHVSGRLLETDQILVLNKIMKCALHQSHRRCLSGEKSKWQFLGCHLPGFRVGLGEFSFRKCNNPFWFSFYQKTKNQAGRKALYTLDKKGLAADLRKAADLCPCYPEEAFAVFESFPATVNLSGYEDFHMWSLSKRNVYGSYLRHFPTLVPRNPNQYNRWVQKFIQTEKNS